MSVCTCPSSWASVEGEIVPMTRKNRLLEKKATENPLGILSHHHRRSPTSSSALPCFLRRAYAWSILACRAPCQRDRSVHTPSLSTSVPCPQARQGCLRSELTASGPSRLVLPKEKGNMDRPALRRPH